MAKSRSSQIANITTLKYDVHTDNMISLRQMTRLGCGKKKTFSRMVVRGVHLFSVFISHVIKTKNRNHFINKFKNLGYDR